jgi:hypothetical protein
MAADRPRSWRCGCRDSRRPSGGRGNQPRGRRRRCPRRRAPGAPRRAGAVAARVRRRRLARGTAGAARLPTGSARRRDCPDCPAIRNERRDRDRRCRGDRRLSGAHRNRLRGEPGLNRFRPAARGQVLPATRAGGPGRNQPFPQCAGSWQDAGAAAPSRGDRARRGSDRSAPLRFTGQPGSAATTCFPEHRGEQCTGGQGGVPSGVAGRGSPGARPRAARRCRRRLRGPSRGRRAPSGRGDTGPVGAEG